MDRQETLAEALLRLDGYSYLDGPGLPSHGPMGAEALSSLGHDDLVPAWVEAYKQRHPPLDAPPPTEPLDSGDEATWRPALGDFGRVADWAGLFAAEIAERPWQQVLGTWVPRLLPGYAGGLTHGLVRVAHAVRVLPRERAPRAPLLDEIVRGLALWAASYRELPGCPRLCGSLPLDQALARVPLVDPAAGWSVMQTATFVRMGELSGFPEAVEALGAATCRDPLGELSAAFCRAILANPGAPAGPLVHAVTPVVAARTLLDRVPGLDGDDVYARLWHVGAAIVAGFVLAPGPRRPRPAPAADASAEPPDPGVVTTRAVEHRDVHVLKFSDACLREHACNPDPVYLRAAAHVVDAMPTW